jgi:hypothetical protein
VTLLLLGYARSGHLSTTAVAGGLIAAFFFLLLPQFGLGLYLIRHSLAKPCAPEKDES